MRKILSFTILICWLATSLSACTAVTGLVTSAATNNGRILYADGFSNAESGWSTWKNDASQVSYQDGGLRIVVNQPNLDIWSRPARRYADTRIEVDVRRNSGPANNDFGILCRYRNSSNFYALLISSDQYYGIVHVQDGKYSVLSGGEMQFSGAIHTGDAVNQLRGDCVGSKLRLYINGTLAAEVEDDAIQSGEIGLMAGAFDEPGVDVWFDNFIVLKP